MSRRNFYIKTHTLDKALFRELYEFLRSRVLKGNLSMTARLLGVSRATVIKWESDYPPSCQWWWTSILTMVIKELLSAMRQSSSRSTRQHEANIHLELKKLLPDEDFELYEVNDHSNARRHVLSLFKEYDQVSTRMLRSAAYSGGYNIRTLRNACESLQLDKEVRGFGENKVTYYTLPEVDR